MNGNGNNITSDLGDRSYSLLKTKDALVTQGYLFNNAKEMKFGIINILQGCVGNPHVFDDEQKRAIDYMVCNV